MTWRLPIFAALLGVLSACSSTGDPSPSAALLPPSETPGSQPTPVTAAPSATVTPSLDASAEPGAAIAVDELARITVENLTVRAEPSTAAEQVGTLPVDAAALVIAGPVQADGYTWYRLASPGTPSVEWCSGETPAFHCGPWIGWAAGLTSTGDRWIERLRPDCASGRDTASYLSMDTLTRFACAGTDEWRLVTYLAPAGGRGCFPAWLVDPYWMDPCSLFFPQPVESDFDSDTRIQGFIPPEVGQFDGFAGLHGSWVEVVGHFDDPIAQTCRSVRNEAMNPEDPALLPQEPDADLVVFMCRLNFVVTNVSATAPPS